MANIETKEVGIDIEHDKGTFDGVELDGEKLRLAIVGEIPESQEQKEYRESIESGDRRHLISASSSLSFGIGSAETFFDGSTSNSLYFASGQDIADKGIEVGFSLPVAVEWVTITQSNNTSQGVWVIQGSNNSTNWTSISEEFTWNSSEIEVNITKIGRFLYYRIQGISGTTSTSPWLREIKFVTESLDGAVYEKEGSWTSEVIDLVDKFKEYDKVVLSKNIPDGTNYAILVRVSEDGSSFTDFTPVSSSGEIQLDPKRYVQVKINLFAGFEDSVITYDFESEEDVEQWENNTYIETTDGSLKLKREYSFEMEEDTSWNDEGSLHRKLIKRDEWKKIDSLEVE